jgi:hypothetical protein
MPDPQTVSSTPDTVTLKVSDYLELVHSDAAMSALQAAGVDNWAGYDEVDWEGVDAHVAQTAEDLRLRIYD